MLIAIVGGTSKTVAQSRLSARDRSLGLTNLAQGRQSQAATKIVPMQKAPLGRLYPQGIMPKTFLSRKTITSPGRTLRASPSDFAPGKSAWTTGFQFRRGSRLRPRSIMARDA